MLRIANILRALLCLLLASCALGANPLHAAEPADPPVALAAELRVMAADAALLADPATPALRRDGLRDRILGSLAYLDFQVRAARERQPDLPAPTVRAAELRAALRNGELDAVRGKLLRLTTLYPFDPRPFLTQANADVARARAIHAEHCAACHDAGDTAPARPAENLFALARRAPPDELIARLVIGVRGTPEIGLRNPLTEAEIAALATLYRTDRPAD